MFDQYEADKIGTLQRHLNPYLVDFTKERARSNFLTNKEAGVFEAYKLIPHQGLNVSDKQALDVEAQLLNSRRANTEKDVATALQKLKKQLNLSHRGELHSLYEPLKQHYGKTAITILINMMPTKNIYGTIYPKLNE